MEDIRRTPCIDKTHELLPNSSPIAKAGRTYAAAILGTSGTASSRNYNNKRKGSRRHEERRIKRGGACAKMATDDDDEDDDEADED